MIDKKYIIAAITKTIIILGVILLISENTFKSSMQINALKVMVTMLAKESLKKMIEVSKITEPWYRDFHTHMQKVLKLSALPF